MYYVFFTLSFFIYIYYIKKEKNWQWFFKFRKDLRQGFKKRIIKGFEEKESFNGVCKDNMGYVQ